MNYNLVEYYIIYYKKNNNFESIRITSKLVLLMYKIMLDRSGFEYYVIKELKYE